MKKMSLLLVGFALVGAGCFDTFESNLTDLWGYCLGDTPWGSCITSNGVDPAILGTWRLEEQTLATPAGTVTNKFHGRTTTFKVESFDLEDLDDEGDVISTTTVADLVFVEDWSSEVEDTGVCTVTGTSGGSWNISHGLNLDMAPPSDIYELEILTDPVNPSVSCESGGEVSTSNVATTPMGVGPGSYPTPEGLSSSTYTYVISGGQLVIMSEGTVSSTYVFSR